MITELGTGISTQAATLLAHGDDWNGPGPWAPLFFLGWILIFWLVFAIFARRFWWRRQGGPPWHHSDIRAAETVLAERYARGEIDEGEYRHRRAVLAEEKQPKR